MRLHGFDAQIAAIDRALVAAEKGIGSVVLVEGHAGEGKSTLLMSAAIAALDRDFAVVSSLDRPALTFAGRALADLPSTFQGLPVLGDEPSLPQLRGRLAAHQTSRHRGHDVPLLVTLDDLHELPPSSLRLLTSLPTQYANSPVVWLLSRRIGLGPAEVQRLFSPGGSDVVLVRLEAMDLVDTRSLVREVIQAEPTIELLTLAQMAGGNRLLVVELVTGLIEEHGAAMVTEGAAGLGSLALPQRLRNAVAQMLCLLSDRCRDMLRIVALAGTRLSLSDIAALLFEPVGTVVALISEATDGGILTGDASGLVFLQELTRRILTTEVPPSVAGLLAEEVSGQPVPRRPRPDPGKLPLSESQWVVARLVASGLTNQQIANRLSLSPHTVNYHLRRIFHTLAIHSRAELATLIPQEGGLRTRNED